MNTKNQTNLIVIGKYERLKKNKKERKKKKKETFRDCMLTRTSYCTHTYYINLLQHILKCYTIQVSNLGPLYFKGCGMGPRHVLVSPCFRENVVVTCKIGSFFV